MEGEKGRASEEGHSCCLRGAMATPGGHCRKRKVRGDLSLPASRFPSRLLLPSSPSPQPPEPGSSALPCSGTVFLCPFPARPQRCALQLLRPSWGQTQATGWQNAPNSLRLFDSCLPLGYLSPGCLWSPSKHRSCQLLRLGSFWQFCGNRRC